MPLMNCYKADVLKKKASSEVPKIPDVNKNVDNQKPVENHHQSNEVVKKRNRCHVCSKRVGLVPFLCRCGESFCGLHRMPEKHACKFDFKAAGRVVIEKQNPICVADKLKFRRFIDDGICVLDGSPTKWLNLIPIKINILAWRVALNKLPTRFNMSLRGMEVSTMKCSVCRVGNKTSDHLFFSCSLASAMISRYCYVIVNNIVHAFFNGKEIYNKKTNATRKALEAESEIYKIISRRRIFSHGLQKKSRVITDKADNIVVVMDLIVLTKSHMLNALWNQFDALIELPRCTCHAADDFKKHNQLMKLMQFIMGLDDTYMQIRSSILSRETFFDVRSAYAIISSEVSHMIATGELMRVLPWSVRIVVSMVILLIDVLKFIGYPLNFGKKKENSVNGKGVQANMTGFLNLDGSIDHSEIPYDDERSDPSFSRYVTPSSHSGSTSNTHNKNKGGHSLGSDAASSENDRSANPKDNDNNNSEEWSLNYFSEVKNISKTHNLRRHQVPPEALATHAAWIKGKKEVDVLMLLTMDLEI
nr:ribonuclease H-like domain-containing protein [Tanacetum cinerariifolium]